MPELDVLLLQLPLLLIFLLLVGGAEPDVLSLFLASLQEVLNSSLVLRLHFCDVLNRPVVPDEELEEWLQHGLQNIQVEVFHHPKETLLAHLSYLVAQLAQRHFHRLPKSSEVPHSNLGEARTAAA